MSWKTVEPELQGFDYVGTITRASFGTDAKYVNGEVVCLILDIDLAEPYKNKEDVLVTERTELFPLGKGWVSEDGKIAHKEDKTPLESEFTKTSWIGRLIDRVAELGLAEQLQAKGDATEAKIWEGLTFRFAQETVNFGGKIGDKQHIMPQEVVTSGSTSVTPAAAAPGTKTVASGPDTATLADQVAALARALPTYDDFVKAATAIPGVAADQQLLAQVLNRESGIFVTAKA